MSTNHANILDQMDINTDLGKLILTGFIRSEVHRVGFTRGVIGLSGGIDSALSAYLAAEALGAENLLGVRMPYAASSPESLQHAQLVIDDLGIPSETIEITDMVEPLFALFPDMSDLRKGNIMARTRMTVLFDQSAAFNGLVMGTSNKTEMLLGYSTQFGDSAAAIQPIADLYKHQVRQLARAVGVPDVIIDKAPSADLWPGQTDEDELGFSYEDVDQVLFLLVDQRFTVDEAVAAGLDRAFVERIWNTIRRTQYKRAMPIVAKLSQRTTGYDFLYMRDWGT